MKSRIANRVLLTAVMALVLGALLAVSSFAAIGLSEEGLLIGLEEGKNYTAAPYDIIANTITGAAQPVDETTDFDTFASGIWAIAGGDKTEYVFVKGANNGKFTVATDNSKASDASGIVAGKWVRSSTSAYGGNTYFSVEDDAVSVGINKSLIASYLKDSAVYYGFTADQVVPANAVTAWNIADLSLPTGVYSADKSAANITSTIEFLVMDIGTGATTIYAATVTGHETGALTVNAPAAMSADDGYVVGVKIAPWNSNDVYTATGYTYLKVKPGTLAYTIKYAKAEPDLPLHEGLIVNINGIVEGLEEGKEYTIQSYNVLTGKKGTKAPLTASTKVEAGVWYVANGEKGGYVFVAGAESGQMTYWNKATNDTVADIFVKQDSIVAGKWSISTGGAYTTITKYANAAKTDVTVCIHLNKPKFLKKAEGVTNYAGATPILGADNKLQESVIYYGFTAEQVVPANQVNKIAFRTAQVLTGACTYNTGKTEADMKGTFTFFVKDPSTGETTNYTIATEGQQKSFTAPAAMAESAGYIVGFAYAPYANSADDLLVCNPNDLNADNGYVHIGLVAGDNKIDFSADFAAPEVAVVDDKLTGLVDGAYYQYTTLVLGNKAELVESTPAKLDANTKLEGLFKVRQTNEDATVYTEWSDILYITGSSINDILNTVQKNDKNGNPINVPVMNNIGGPSAANVLVDVFVPGAWSGFSITDSLQINHGFNKYRIGGTSCYMGSTCKAYVDATDDTRREALSNEITAVLGNVYFSYGYKADEIIPMENWLSYTFTTAIRQTGAKVGTGAIKTKVTLYVVTEDGTVEQRSALYDNTYSGSKDITVKQADFSDISGYVVGMKIVPYFAPEGTKLIGINNTSADHNIQLKDNAYVVKAPAPVPAFEVKANANGNGYDVVITNASPVGTYEYKSATGAWTPVTDNTFTVTETGIYTVKVSGELLIGTAQADVEVKKLTPVAPEFVTAVNSANDFKVTIKDAIVAYTYEYKAEGDADWTAIEGGSFIVAPGTYSVRAGGALFEGYATAEFTPALATAETPKVSVIPGDGTEFTVTIKNYSALYVYEYKLNDASTWTAVEAGAKTFKLTEGGLYTLRAGGAVYANYATVGFKAVEVPQEIKNLVIDSKTGVLSGLAADKAYEYAKVNYLGTSETWTAIPAGTEYTFADAGLYAVRLAATGTEDASTAMVFNKLGTIAERGTIINLETKNYANGVNWGDKPKQIDVIKWTAYSDKNNPQFFVGRWSGHGIGDLQYWTQDWLTAVGRSNYEPVAALGNKINDGTMTQAEAKEYIESFVYKYAYEDAEIIPFADLEKFSVRAGHRQGHIYLQGGVAYAKFVIYVANNYGEIETRELLVKSDYSAINKKINHTISAANFDDVDGYIVAMDVYPFGEITDDAVVKVSGTVGNDYELKLLDYQVKLPRVPAPDYLAFDEDLNLVTGLDPEVEYFYAPYTVNGVGETKYVYDVETLELTTGLWGIGIVSTDPEYADSLPYIVYVKGDEEARGDLGERKPDGYYITSGTDTFQQGVWSGTTTATHSTFGANGLSTLGGHVTGAYATKLKNAIDAGDAGAEAAARASIVDVAASVAFKYAMTNDEVIAANELLNFVFKQSARMGSLDLGAGTTAKVTFYVITPEGTTETYVWEQETSTSTTQVEHNVDAYELLKGVDGWVVAIEVNPWTKVTPKNIILKDANGYNTMSQIVITDYSIKLAPEAPVVETLEAPSASGLGEIANLVPAMTYEYRTYDAETDTYGEWTAIPAGSTSVRLPAGDYQLRVAESRNFTESDEVNVTILRSDVERESLMNETKKIHLPNDFIEVSANYEIDVTTKVWVSRLALDNIKAVAPDSTITISGDGFKYVVLASDIATEKLVHYYNLDLSFDGESKFDKTYSEIVELAGDAYILEFFTESVNALPFESAELHIEVGTKYDGQDVELRAYNERIGKLRKTESATVADGWVMFTNFGSTFVVMGTEE